MGVIRVSLTRADDNDVLGCARTLLDPADERSRREEMAFLRDLLERRGVLLPLD